MSLDELLTTWVERDHRYSIRRPHGRFMPVTEAERAAILAFRHREVDLLPETARGMARNELVGWQPPMQAMR